MNLAAPVSALVMALVGSVHCIAMCGGVVVLANAAMPVRLRRKPRRQAPVTAAYHAGRIASYAAFGALAGGAGALVGHVAPVRVAEVLLRALAAVLLVAVGLSVAGLASPAKSIERLGAYVLRPIAPLARRFFPITTPWRALAAGSLWGFMPCGLVYSALAVALLSGSSAEGALTMAAFGVGTLPMLLAMGGLAAGLSRVVARPRVRAMAGLGLATLGVVSLLLAADQLLTPRDACCDPAAHGVQVHGNG